MKQVIYSDRKENLPRFKHICVARPANEDENVKGSTRFTSSGVFNSVLKPYVYIISTLLWTISTHVQEFLTGKGRWSLNRMANRSIFNET